MFQMLSLLLLPASQPACLVLRLSFAVVLVARFLCRPMFGTFCATNYSGPTNFSSKHHWMEWRTQWNSRGGGERERKNTGRIDSKWAVTFSIIFNCTIKVSKTCFLLLFVLKSGICCGFADGFFSLYIESHREADTDFVVSGWLNGLVRSAIDRILEYFVDFSWLFFFVPLLMIVDRICLSYKG